jgi:NADH-quinone oxidoreductase subunit J
LLAIAVVFFLLGAPFAAALEVIIYAGAIMVLFIFVVMMLNLGAEGVALERRWYQPSLWRGPGLLALALLVEFVFVISTVPPAAITTQVGPQAVSARLMTHYGLGVELASFVLLSGLIGAFHIGRRQRDWTQAEETR